MEYEIVSLEEKTLVGISVKTGNSDPDTGKIIGGLWDRFFKEDLPSHIQNKKSEMPICLYSDYKTTAVSGQDLEYDVTVGYSVSDTSNTNHTLKIIPAANYAKFSVKGNVATAVSDAWQSIWAMPLKRSFTGDFEEYLNNSMDEAEVDIYVALKD